MGNQCCTMQTTCREPPYTHITQKPIFYENYTVSQWPQNDPVIVNWMSQNKSLDILKKQPLKHKHQNKYFLGNWNKGAPQGWGIIYSPQIYLLEGNFVKGMLNGHCKVKMFKEKQEFEGNLVNGKAEGMGIFRDQNNKTKFEGIWQNSVPKSGSLLFVEDPNYEIIEIQDYQSGIATIYFKNNQKYTGSIQPQTMSPHGHGKVTFPFCSDKFEFDGEFRYGKMHGKGHLLWKDKSQYSGEYIDGQKYGYGEYIFVSGKKYQGYWINGKQQGPGVLLSAQNQVIKRGVWKQGNFIEKISENQYSQLMKKYQKKVLSVKQQVQINQKQQSNKASSVNLRQNTIIDLQEQLQHFYSSNPEKISQTYSNKLQKIVGARGQPSNLSQSMKSSQSNVSLEQYDTQIPNIYRQPTQLKLGFNQPSATLDTKNSQQILSSFAIKPQNYTKKIQKKNTARITLTDKQINKYRKFNPLI